MTGYLAFTTLAALMAAIGCGTESPTAIPAEVTVFIENRDTCDHLRGEIPDRDQTSRAREVADGLRKYCTGTDRELSRLRTKYASDRDIVSMLAGYESHIEPRKRADGR